MKFNTKAIKPSVPNAILSISRLKPLHKPHILFWFPIKATPQTPFCSGSPVKFPILISFLFEQAFKSWRASSTNQKLDSLQLLLPCRLEKLFHLLLEPYCKYKYMYIQRTKVCHNSHDAIAADLKYNLFQPRSTSTVICALKPIIVHILAALFNYGQNTGAHHRLILLSLKGSPSCSHKRPRVRIGVF